MRAVKTESAGGGFFMRQLYKQLLGLLFVSGDKRAGNWGEGWGCDRDCGQIGKEGKEKAYEVWIGFVVDAAFARGDADFEGERSIPDALSKDCGGCHFLLRGRLGMGWGCGERLARKHFCGVVADWYHPCSGRDEGEEVIVDNESL